MYFLPSLNKKFHFFYFMRWTSSSVYSLSLPFLLANLQFSCSVVSDSLQPRGLQQTKLPSLSLTVSWRLLKFMSVKLVMPSNHLILCLPFSSHLQSFSASGSFLVSRLFAAGGQSIGVSASASVLPMNIQDWFPLRLTGLLSLQSKGLSRAFSNTRVLKHRFFGAQPSLWSYSHIHTWLLEKPQLWQDLCWQSDASAF